MLTLGLRELTLGLPTLKEPILGLRVLTLGLCELIIVLRKLTLDFLWWRSEGANSRSIFVKELITGH